MGEFHRGHETGIIVVGVEGKDFAAGQPGDVASGESLGHDQKGIAVEGDGGIADAALAAVVPVARRRRAPPRPASSMRALRRRDAGVSCCPRQYIYSAALVA